MAFVALLQIKFNSQHDDIFIVRWKILVAIALVMGASLAGCIVQKPPAAPPAPGRSAWAFNATQVQAMNDLGFTGRGVRVAIIDTGIDMGHGDFAGLCVTVWVDLVQHRAEPYDDDGHGTQMAGILWGHNGGAPNASLIVIKAIDGQGKSTDSTVADAVRLAMDPNQDGDNGDAVDIISMSLGGGRVPLIGTETERAVNDAIVWGIFVVAAAGNDGQNDNGDVDSPASVKNVIAVGAVDSSLELAAFSSVGSNSGSFFPPVLPRSDPDKKPELVAPGVDVWMPVPGGGYAYGSGTSPATVFVSTALAVMLDALPQYRQSNNAGETTIVKFKQAFMETARTLDSQATPHDDGYGYGLVQAHDAYLTLSAG